MQEQGDQLIMLKEQHESLGGEVDELAMINGQLKEEKKNL